MPLSPVPHLLQNNSPPSDLEREHTRAEISGVHADLIQLDNEIAGARDSDTLCALQNRRDTLKKYHYQHAAVLSPVRTLPPELLGEIFITSLPTVWKNTARAPKHSLSYKGAVLLPGQVCRHWRNVALATPRLWSAISVDPPRGGDLNLMKSWLSRSAQSPVIIALGDPLLSAFFASNEIINTLCAHAHHCHRLALHVRMSPSSVRDISECQFTTLRTLELNMDSMDGSWDLSTSAPLLSKVTLLRTANSSHHNPNIPAMQWIQLTQLTLVMPSLAAHQLANILREARNLISLRLTTIRLDSTISYHPIIHDKLRLLETNFSYSDLLDHLTLPRLQVYRCRLKDLWPHEAFISFLTRSKCSLESYVMNIGMDGRMAAEELIACLQHMPSLLNLEILGDTAAVLNEGMLQRLIFQSTDSCEKWIVPKLQRLAIVIQQPDRFPFDTLLELVRSRRIMDVNHGETQPIKLVHLQHSVGFPLAGYDHSLSARSAIAGLVSLKTEGLDIRTFDAQMRKIPLDKFIASQRVHVI